MSCASVRFSFHAICCSLNSSWIWGDVVHMVDCCVPHLACFILFFFFRDYRPIPGLDKFDIKDLDEGDYDAMSPATRARAEEAMRKRDRSDALATGRMRRGLLYGKVFLRESSPWSYDVCYDIKKTYEHVVIYRHISRMKYLLCIYLFAYRKSFCGFWSMESFLPQLLLL